MDVSEAASREPAGGAPPGQEEIAFAMIGGEPVTELPRDLYIPPNALEVLLDVFEGPLDLLLYLVKRQNIDILDIPIAEITRQYIAYIDLLKEFRIERAADYLVMATMLAEIKSRLLLPQPECDDEEEDPRAELVRRLQEYERYKHAAEQLDELPRFGRDVIAVQTATPYVCTEPPQPNVELKEFIAAFAGLLKRMSKNNHYQVRRESLSVRDRMSLILERAQREHFVEFTAFLTPQEGRQGVVVTLLALLELLCASLVTLVQAKPFGPIHIKAVGK